jgi:transcriptional regulator with XRE-family HTH domain
MTPTELGTTIREYRERAGLTQDGLGRLIAVDPDLIDQWEWGEQAPGDGDAERISEVLGIPSAQLRDSDVAVEISPDGELVVIEIMAAAPVPSSPAPRRPVEPRAMIEVPSIWHRLRDAASSDPTRAAWVSAVLLVAVIAVIFVVVVLGTGSAPSTTSFGSSTTAGERGEAEVLREQRDRLIVRVDELTEELEQAEDRAAAAEAEALRLDGVDERNTRLEAENELLRKAVVVSSAGDDVQAVALTLDAGDSADAVARGGGPRARQCDDEGRSRHEREHGNTSRRPPGVGDDRLGRPGHRVSGDLVPASLHGGLHRSDRSRGGAHRRCRSRHGDGPVERGSVLGAVRPQRSQGCR